MTPLLFACAIPNLSHTVRSCIHHCPLRDSDETVVVNGKAHTLTDGKKTFRDVRWIHVRNYGYVFPKPLTLDLLVGSTTRSYSYINQRYGSARKYTRRFYTVTVDHGSSPKAGHYNAVIHPAVTASRTRALADDPAVQVASSKAAHVVKDTSTGATVCVFFGKDRIDGFRADRPLVVVVTNGETGSRVSVQDPTHRGGKVELRIPFVLSGPATKSDGNGTIVSVELQKGYPRTVEFGR